MSGSLAKGTALSTINDIDVAMYVKSEGAPNELGKLLEWLVGRLRKTFPQISPDKIAIMLMARVFVISFKRRWHQC